MDDPNRYLHKLKEVFESVDSVTGGVKKVNDLFLIYQCKNYFLLVINQMIDLSFVYLRTELYFFAYKF